MRGKEHQFRKLHVWTRSQLFITSIYGISAKFPRHEQFCLTDQLRRAAISISLNIAEGSGSSTEQEFIRFLHIAKRSTYEVIACLEIALNLKYIEKTEYILLIEEAEEICAMIVGFSKQLLQ